MDVKRLFGVLVLGGAALGCDDVSPGSDAAVADATMADAVRVDSSTMGDSSADAGAVDAGGEDALVFCPTEEACDAENVRPGFVCCWGTSC